MACRAGADFFDPDVVTRGGEREIAESLARGLLQAARPAAQSDRLISAKVVDRKKNETRMTLAVDFRVGRVKHRATITVVLTLDQKRPQLATAAYHDDCESPWDRERVAEFRALFNGK